MRNNLLISLVLAASTSSVFAMPYDPMKHCGILELALTGGGFEADVNNTAYGILASGVNGAAPTYVSGAMLKNDPKYKFGGSVLLGYYFPESTYNVDISYTGSRNTLEDHVFGTTGGTLLGPSFGEVTTAGSSYTFDYNYVNIEVGSLTRVNQNGLIINPQIGLSYARLKSEQTATYQGGVLATTNAGAVYRDSVFKGFGPSIGLDLNYTICRPITLSGNFRYNALIGNVNATNSISTTLDPDISAVSLGSNNAVVSLFQTELALGYDFNLYDMFCGNLAIGYQVTKSLGNVEQMAFLQDTGTSAFTNNPALDNSLQGYFLRLTMDFNV